MACKIIYKGISYDEFDFKSQIERYVTINNLFNENESLANAVYESLGFEQVYHGSKTTEKYSEYKIPVNKGVDSLGSFFTSDLDGALMFTPDFIDESPIAKDLKERTGKVTYKKDRSYVKKEYLKLQNPYSVDIRKWEDNSWINDFVKGDFSIYNFNEVPLEIVDRVKKILIDRGHDGIYIAKDFYVGNIESRYDQYIVFDPNKTLKQQKQQAQQLYSQYLDTIFPNSKVKDIVYRGKTDSQTNIKSKELGIFFTDDKNAANIYAVKYKGDEFDDSIIQGIVNKFGLNPTIEQIKSEIAFFEKMGATKEQIEKDAKEFQNYILNNKGKSEQAILNIKNPKNLTVKDWFDNYDNSSTLKENSDGILLKGGKQSNNRIYDAGENQIVVFEPEQIHILGSKQDIEGFKNYVSKNNQEQNPEENKIINLEQKLISGFLKDFNITVTEYNNLKVDLGIDAYTASDLVTKAIAFQKGESILPEVAYFAYSILGKQNNKIKSQLKYLIYKWDKYKERFDIHSKSLNEKEGFIKDSKEWKSKINDLIILDFFVDNLKNPKADFTKITDSKWTKEDFGVWETILQAIEKFLLDFNFKLKTDIEKKELLENLGMSIADELLNQSYSYFDYNLKPEQIQKYYKNTIESDAFAKELVEFGQSNNMILTGSLALRKAGTVYRTSDETLHDIDWVIPFDGLLKQPELLEDVVKNRRFDNVAFSKYFTKAILPKFDWYQNFVKKYPSYKILNDFVGSEHLINKESVTIQGVINGEFYTSDGKHEEEVSYFKKDPETKKPIKVKENRIVNHKKGDWVKDTGYVVDFFIRLYPKQEEHENYFKLWKEIMIAKLKMGREKDLTDWKSFVPYLKSNDIYNFKYKEFRHLNYISNPEETLNLAEQKNHCKL